VSSERDDWIVYLAWVGLMLGLCLTTGGFVWVGHRTHAPLPAEAYLVPLGASSSRWRSRSTPSDTAPSTRKPCGAARRWSITSSSWLGIASCVLLCAAYSGGATYAVPALVLTVLSFLYSLVDEVMHWRRYLAAGPTWSRCGATCSS
jgi:hypothetical protein